jgi:hypothetical protein
MKQKFSKPSPLIPFPLVKGEKQTFTKKLQKRFLEYFKAKDKP